MTYRVVILPQAERQLMAAAAWWAKNRSSEQASRWLDGFESALSALSKHPASHPLARENDAFPFEVRQMLYGLGRRFTHRAVFEIRGDCVFVYAIRHLAQAPIRIGNR